MRLQRPDSPLVETLRSEQEVDTETAPHAPDGVEDFDKGGLGFEQLAELIDYYDQVGERVELILTSSSSLPQRGTGGHDIRRSS